MPLTIKSGLSKAPRGGQPGLRYGNPGDAGDGVRHPLIVISHGNGGGPLAHADTAEALVHAGYVVVAIAHAGDTKGDDRDPGRKWLIERVRQVSRVVDYMASKWDDRATIDPDRIGAFGFSAGGFTMLVASGASPSADRAKGHCRTDPTEFACKLGLANELSRLVGEKGTSYPWPHDARIKATVIAAPSLGFSFDRQGLSRVTVPIQLWAAENDDRAPIATNTAPLRNELPVSPEFHLVKRAGHFAFSRPCEPNDPKRHSCKENADFKRSDFHALFNREIVGFFNRTLQTPTRAQ